MGKVNDYAEVEPYPELPNVDEEAEEALLDCLLINPYSIADILFLQPGWMWNLRYRLAFATMLEIYNRGDVPDQLALISELKLKGKWQDFGEYETLSLIGGRAITSTNTLTYARAIAVNAFKRGLFDIGRKIADLSDSGESEINKLMLAAHSMLDDVPAANLDNDLVPLTEAHDSEFARLEAIQNGESVPDAGVSTGYIDMDGILGGGFHAGNLVIIAGRPGWGKTSFMLNLAANMATNGEKMAYFSLEMDQAELSRRIDSMVTGIPMNVLRSGKLSPEQWNEYVKHTDTTGRITGQILVNQLFEISVPYIRSKIRTLIKSDDIKAVFVDYLGLMQASSRQDNRRAELEQMTLQLKNTARALAIPIIVATQMNRAVEGRASNEPNLSDLRETGSQEQDADVVMFIYPEKEATKDIQRKVKIEKQRNGATGDFFLQWEPKRTLLRNFADDYGYSSRALWEPRKD